MINKITLIGNLGKDPEVRKLESGQSVGTFSLATSESFKNKNGEWESKTEWLNIVVWGYLAEYAGKLSKGNQVYIDGKITTRQYVDKDGVTRYSTEVVANTLRLLGAKPKQETETFATFEEIKASDNSKDYELLF